jgi:xylitol oxidase
MKKRTFLRLSSGLVASAALGPHISCSRARQDTETKKVIRNWAGNFSYATDNVLQPTTLEEVQQMVREQSSCRALGTRHCFNKIADSASCLISTSKLNQIGEINREQQTIIVGAGVRYGDFCQAIDEQGFAIHNLASLPHISVAGACATATHGSGVSNGNLATAVSAIELVTADGDVHTYYRGKESDFNGVVVNLGMLGVVTRVTLDLVPSFRVRQNVYLDLPMDQWVAHFDEIMSSGYRVSLFTDWQGPSVNQVWIKRVAPDGESFEAAPEFYGARAATTDVHPILSISAENCTEQMGVPGAWYDRLPHFKMGFTPSSGEELQAEYFVARRDAMAAIQAVATLASDIQPFILITEIRTIDADDLWMSPCYDQPSVAIHFTLKQDIEGVNNLLPKIEAKLDPFVVRPHWGKLFTLAPAALQARYAQLDAFKDLAARLDPEGKFRNDFITRNLA